MVARWESVRVVTLSFLRVISSLISFSPMKHCIRCFPRSASTTLQYSFPDKGVKASRRFWNALPTGWLRNPSITREIKKAIDKMTRKTNKTIS